MLRRHDQRLHAQLLKRVTIESVSAGGSVEVTLDIVPDEDDPYALLTAFDTVGEQLAQVRVAANFKLSNASASVWVDNAFRLPG